MATYPQRTWYTHVRVGSLPLELGTGELDTEEARMVHGSFARWVDAVVVLDDRTLLVEGKIIAHPVAIGQLLLYRRLLPATPFLNLRTDLPVEMVLLFARADPLVSVLAMEQGISLVQFEPAWVDEYMATRHHRHRNAPLPQGLAPVSE